MSPRFDTILIANRGEIACRVIRAAHAEGLRAVAVYSDADADALHVQLADAAVRIGPAAPSQSYLSISAVIDAARASGAQAVHPGYGFLSENADFAQACLDNGLVFIGPPPAAMRAMGDKSAAKLRMIEAGVPCAPGYHGEDQSAERFAAEAERIGFPVMIKASAGGGGRGMRIVHTSTDVEPARRAASAEALSAFGDGRLLLERALIGARHVEVQIFGDAYGAMVHLGERDCSIQRRHQKIIEETPSPAVSPELRGRMGNAAVQAARSVGYVGAGTVEFLLDERGEFFFLEMNTRIQVEHPVTEMITGIDLVRLQISVAQGEPLPFLQSDIALNGCAIEARICAEDAYADFLPAAGEIAAWRPGAGEGVRVDHGLREGGFVTPYYDSLLAKVIAHGATREQARRRLVRALEDTMLAGVVSNRDFLIATLKRPDFIDGGATTAFLTSGAKPEVPRAAGATVALAALLYAENGPAPSPTAAWRRIPLRLEANGVATDASIRRDGSDSVVAIDGEAIRLRVLSVSDSRELSWRAEGEAIQRPRHAAPGWLRRCAPRQDGGRLNAIADVSRVRFDSDGVMGTARFFRRGAYLKLDLDGVGYDFVDRTYDAPRREDDAAGGGVRSPVSGVLVGVEARAGDHVKRGQPLATVEAMKMQYLILAPIDGLIVGAHAVDGAQALAKALLFEIKPVEEAPHG